MRRMLTTAAAIAIVASAMLPASGADVGMSSDDAGRLGTTMPRSTLASQSTYFVMTDRYANGSTANDNGDPSMAAGLAAGGFDPADPGMFHGGDFVGLTANLDRINRMGFTSVWVTPPFVNRAVQGGSAGYHGYWIVDFTHIDPHLGTAAQFAAFVDKAHALGLKVVLDIVMNHTADVIQYKDGNAFGPAGSKQPFIPAGLEQAKSPAWLNDLANYHNQGNIGSWSNTEQVQNGDFYGLDDIKTEQQVVVDGFAQVYGDWITKYGIDGFRIDTARHVDPAFFTRWVPALVAYVRAHGRPDFTIGRDFNLFGEVAAADPVSDASFLRDRGLMSILDFPLQDAVLSYTRSGNARAVSDVLAYDDFYNAGGDVNAYSLVTFTGNHDMGRLGYLLGSQASVARIAFATALTSLLRGAPVTYYGDEVGMAGSGGDKLARQDMLPTKVAAWRTEPRIGGKPIGNASSLGTAALANPIAKYVTKLNGLRASYAGLRDGALLLRASNGSLLAWSRVDAGERREYVLVANGGGKAARVTVRASTPSARFRAILGTTGSVSSSARGDVVLTVPAMTVVAYRADALLPATSAAPALTTTASVDRDAGGAVLTASGATGRDPLTVTFAARTCATCAWTALGSDDAAPYRFVLPASAWAGGDYLDVVAIARTSDGRTAAGPVLHVTHADLA